MGIHYDTFKPMNMVVIGAYLKAIREGKGLQQNDIAAEVSRRLGHEVRPTTIWKIEKGKMVPGGEMIIALSGSIGANIHDLAQLQLDRTATARDGIRLAEERIAADREEAKRDFVRSSTPQELTYVLERLVEDATREPGLIEFVRRLLPSNQSRDIQPEGGASR